MATTGSLYRKILSIVLWFGMRNRRVLVVDFLSFFVAAFTVYGLRLSYLLLGGM